jgi:hypothetical protein
MNLIAYLPVALAIIAIVPGLLAYRSGKRQEGSKATREDFESLRLAYREDNKELRTAVDRLEGERDDWRKRLRAVETSEEVCTRRLSWLLGKLNIPLAELDRGMNGEPVDFT